MKKASKNKQTNVSGERKRLFAISFLIVVNSRQKQPATVSATQSEDKYISAEKQ